MRRMLLTATAASALALGAPAAASAHHRRHHKHHSTHAHVLLFKSRTVPASGATPTSAPTAPSSEPAGTVTKFEGGVLTITLADGSVVKGKVTEQTRLECPSSTVAGADRRDDQGGGDDQSGRDSGENGGPTQIGQEHRDFQGEDAQDAGDDDGQLGQESCTSAALVPGAKVGEAELVITSAGPVWEKVDLIN
jgi:hypothetical protein